MFNELRDGADKAREGGRRARRRVVDAIPRRAPDRRPSLLAGLLAAAGGALVAYLLDPERGRGRRAQLRDQGAARLRDVLTSLRGQALRARSSAFEIRQQITHRGDGAPPSSDAALSDKVHSELFVGSSIPRSKLNINVEEGVVVLRGELDDPAQVDELVRRAERIPGVVRVDSLLHLPGEPAPAEPPRRHPAVTVAGPKGELP